MAKKSAVLKEKRILTSDVFELVFEVPEAPCTFVAGQFVSIEVPPRHEEEKMVMRQYSISSRPRSEHIFELCYKKIPGGRATDGLFSNLEINDMVQFVGPAGHFTLKREHNPLVFIATGTGVAPFKSMLEDLWARGHKGKTTLLFGVSFVKDLFYHEYFGKKEGEEDFTFHPCVSRPERSWEGFSGRVTAHLESHFDYAPDTDFYICGNGSVIEDVKRILLEKGVEKEHIFFEKYNNL